MKVTIALCTRERPKMLENCLRSIQSLDIPEDCSLHVVLIENSDQPNCKEIAQNIMKTSTNIGLTYKLEKNLGLSNARNTSVETAIETQADWIAFIDDDEVVAKDWLMNFHSAILTDSADVYTGPVEHVLIEEKPIWYKDHKRPKFEHFCMMELASTGNTIAKVQFFNGEWMSLRFDQAYNFSGGEDIRLFKHLIKEGGIIRYVEDAVAYEHRPIERTSKKWVIRHGYYSGNYKARDCIETDGHIGALKLLISEFVSRSCHGLLYLVWGILLMPFSKRYIRYLVKGITKLSWTAGYCSGLINIPHQFYKKRIDGH